MKNKTKAPLKQPKKRKYTKKINQVPTNNNWVGSNEVHDMLNRNPYLRADPYKAVFGIQEECFGRIVVEPPVGLKTPEQPEFQSLLSALQKERLLHSEVIHKLFWAANAFTPLNIDIKMDDPETSQGIIASLWAEINKMGENRKSLETVAAHLQKLVGS